MKKSKDYTRRDEMTSDEHKLLAQYIKDVHSSLRNSASKKGAKDAWLEHCKNKDILVKYADCMEKLATQHWDITYATDNTTTSRITWTADLCFDYFINKSYLKYTKKEYEIAEKMGIKLNDTLSYEEPLKLMDVGSCYNPFKSYDFLDVIAIDLCPANDSVLQCDFLHVPIGNYNVIKNNEAQQLRRGFFDIVTFCFLLEYLPSSEFRIKACEKAYDLLKPGGLLIINTPDSKHVGANCKIMKCWRYALACVGYSRIKYEKFKHMHCMAFRKALHKDTAVRWASISKEPHMEYVMHIPQDFQTQSDNDEPVLSYNIEISPQDFHELPFCD